jgi:Spy/CpxP family protein refolding chaperone
MWRKIATPIFFFSVALNLAFLGVWGARTLEGQPGADEGMAEGCATKCSDGCQLHGPIEMTDEQMVQLKPMLDEFGRERYRLCVQIDRARGELIDALAPDEPDLDLVRQHQTDILDGQRRMQDLTVRQLLREKEVLTPEQQEKVNAYLRDCCRCCPSETKADERSGSCGGM